jgi:hypothetical protein
LSSSLVEKLGGSPTHDVCSPCAYVTVSRCSFRISNPNRLPNISSGKRRETEGDSAQFDEEWECGSVSLFAQGYLYDLVHPLTVYNK